MQNIVIAKTYRFVPPRFSPFWARIVQWYLPTYLAPELRHHLMGMRGRGEPGFVLECRSRRAAGLQPLPAL